MDSTRSIWGRSVSRLLSHLRHPAIRVELWNGEAFGPPAAESVGTVRIADARAALHLLLDLELAAGDLYSQGRLEVDGDLPETIAAVSAMGSDRGIAGRLRPRWWMDWLHRHSGRDSRRNAQRHYDVGNDFYALWLDERMTYTCAYYPTPHATLEQAQVAKMEHVCRKLRLRPGERVIEAGSGWGSLALHMARYHGVSVRAFNVSHEQVLYAREQAEKQGLASRVEFVEDDYRNVTGRCDKFASVGMLEHVGPAHYRTLGDVIRRVLEPDGLGLVHSIGLARRVRMNRWVQKRIFPHSYTPTLSQMMEVFEPHDLAVLDVENLRPHYARTLHHWLERYERAYRQIEEQVGAATARAWRLYLAGCAKAFDEGLLQLFQVQFAHARNAGVPWTRAYLYQDATRFEDL